MKKAFQIILLCALMVGTPVTVMAEELIDGTETEVTPISITLIHGSRVRISNATDEILYVYNITGEKVETIRIDSQDKIVTLNLTKGCYILKVGKVVRKISIR